MQQLALLTLMNDERTAEMEQEHDRFRSMLVAMHPGQAKALLDALDSPDDDPLAPLLEEDAENYERMSHDEVEGALSMMRSLGLAFS